MGKTVTTLHPAGGVPQPVVQHRHVLCPGALRGLCPQGQKDVALDGEPVVLGRSGFAAHRDMFLETEFREIRSTGRIRSRLLRLETTDRRTAQD